MTVRDSIWRELEADRHASTGFCSRRIDAITACALYIAVEKPANRRALLAVGRVSPQFRLPESRGLVVKKVEPSVGGPGTLTLAVVLRDTTFAEIFDVVVKDVARRLERCDSEAEAMEGIIERVLLWQAFLEKQGDRGLSREAQVGLYGELWFLRRYLASLLGWSRAIGAWTGPSGSNQDFQVAKAAFEVKTTTAKQHQRLLISSERQLDSTGLDDLFLVHLSLDARQGAGETLPDLIANIRMLASSHPLALANLTDRLLGIGYVAEMADRYIDVGYTEREHHLLHVAGDFPRIVESDLRRGVGDVHYSIGVAECLSHAASAEHLARIFGET